MKASITVSVGGCVGFMQKITQPNFAENTPSLIQLTATVSVQIHNRSNYWSYIYIYILYIIHRFYHHISGAHFLLRGLTMGSALSSCLVSSPSYSIGQYFGSLFNMKNVQNPVTTQSKSHSVCHLGSLVTDVNMN